MTKMSIHFLSVCVPIKVRPVSRRTSTMVRIALFLLLRYLAFCLERTDDEGEGRRCSSTGAATVKPKRTRETEDVCLVLIRLLLI